MAQEATIGSGGEQGESQQQRGGVRQRGRSRHGHQGKAGRSVADRQDEEKEKRRVRGDGGGRVRQGKAGRGLQAA
eukprot:1987970-Pyramimonas_sp.AAC.1